MSETPAGLDEWVARLQDALGLTDADIPTGRVLDLTRDAAHGVTRPAGPLTTFLLGIAVGRGADFDDASRTIERAVAEWDA